MLPQGLYDRLIDEELEQLLLAHPELSPIFEKLDDESAPQAFSQFLGQVLLKALPIIKPDKRRAVMNRLIELLSSIDGLEYTQRKRLLNKPKTVLRQITATGQSSPFPEPATPLSVSSLLTGAVDDPQLERELRIEMITADRVDILVSFIKWSGLKLLLPAFESLVQKGVEARIITTSYMGASDPHAVEWLAAQPGFSVRVSYDTERTRLHAKAYHFFRKSGYSTAYIGSANMSHPAMTSGLEWTVKVTAQDMPHILARFAAEFETYWARDEFVPFDSNQAAKFREAISFAKRPTREAGSHFFADIKPHAFQERILEALLAARLAGSNRNLVVAATGTGKTVMAAFDYTRFRRENRQATR
ncbi:MAG TPA: phospholipase D-like domain-containing protein, partial [Opitutales bacterium]|nr:phospholipase D-like domain-containing protein [Opitutales bacterium]